MSKRNSRRTCEICGIKEAHLESPRFFANFPLEENRCKEWVRVVGNEDLVHVPIEKLHTNKYVCGVHFKKSQINKRQNKLKKHAVPCLNLTLPPIRDDQMFGFPFHLRKNQVPESGDVSPSKKGPGVSDENASLNPALQSQELNDMEKVKTPEKSSIKTTKIIAKGAKRKILETNEELTPRKKKLVARLAKTKCTLNSLRKSALIIEKIQSPVLKELITNAVKNEKRKPKGRRWTTRHKLACLAILKRSPKAYRYLRAVLTLPTIKTLQNILKKIPMHTGINQSVLTHIKKVSETMDERDRMCCLVFDEMAIKSRLLYNEGNDTVEGFEDLGEYGRTSDIANHALVLMLQGLRIKYKQPIAFYFTKGTISSAKLAMIIKMIIKEVVASGFTIINTVCDQGPTNMGALKILREGSGPFEERSSHYFKIDGKNIYIIYDIPHLFKSVRNNFMNAGSIILDKKQGRWEHLVEMENHNRNFLYLNKITEQHVNLKYKSKMKVKLAAQLLSNTVAAVLKLLAKADTGEKANEMLNTAHVVEELDRLFDITNGPSGPHDIIKNKRENVSEKTNHLEKWAHFIKILDQTKFPGSKNVKCVDGYIISLKSLRDIWLTLKALGYKYLNLRNLNQDALENLFGLIRQQSPTNRNPTAAHFSAALKTAVVTGLTAPHSRGSNCERDTKKLLTNFHDFVFGEEKTIIDNNPQTFEATEIVDIDDADCPVLELAELDEEEMVESDFTLLTEQPVVYVAGYIAKKILMDIDCDICKKKITVCNPEANPIYTYIFLREWWQEKFSLTYPSINFCKIMKRIISTTELELLPNLHEKNVCLLGCTMYNLINHYDCFTCATHGVELAKLCFEKTCKLLVRRQCQRVNLSLASKEEDMASLRPSITPLTLLKWELPLRIPRAPPL